MRKYSEYKKVDLPWLGEIPIHWNFVRNKNVFTEKSEVVGQNSLDYVLLSLTKQGIIPRDMEGGGKFPQSFDSYKKVTPNQIVLCLFDIDETPRTVGISEYYGMITGAYTIMDVHEVNAKYVYYYYLALDNVKALRPLYTGLRKTINIGTFLSSKLPIPPKEEQNQIAHYLDWKINEIDRLIEFQRIKLNEANKIYEKELERLFIEITERERDLKNFIEIPITDGPHETPVFVEEGIPFVSVESVVKGRIDLSRKRGFISEKDHMIYCKKVRPRRDDIFIVKSGSTTGKIALVDFDDQFSIWSPLALVRVNKDVIFLYMYYMLSSEYFQRQIRLNWSFGTQPNIGMKVISALKVKVPSLEIQKFIINKCVRLETAICEFTEKLENQINNLQGLKQSLISEVVTGKIDVRDIEIPAYEKVNLINKEPEDIEREEE